MPSTFAGQVRGRDDTRTRRCRRYLPAARRPLHAVRGVSFTHQSRRDRGDGRRIGLGQELDRATRSWACSPATPRSAGEYSWTARTWSGALRHRCAESVAGGSAWCSRTPPRRSILSSGSARRSSTLLMRHRKNLSRSEAKRVAADIIGEMGIEADRLGSFPHQLSGGMRQRALIAAAMVAEPGLLVADEPTSDLDTVSQAQILRLLRRLRDEPRHRHPAGESRHGRHRVDLRPRRGHAARRARRARHLRRGTAPSAPPLHAGAGGRQRTQARTPTGGSSPCRETSSVSKRRPTWPRRCNRDRQAAGGNHRPVRGLQGAPRPEHSPDQGGSPPQPSDRRGRDARARRRERIREEHAGPHAGPAGPAERRHRAVRRRGRLQAPAGHAQAVPGRRPGHLPEPVPEPESEDDHRRHAGRGARGLGPRPRGGGRPEHRGLAHRRAPADELRAQVPARAVRW